MTQQYAGVDALLAAARSRLQRLTPQDAAAELTDGAKLVDIRPAAQRAELGEIPGALVVERNHLEWRLDPNSSNHVAAASSDQRWIVFCAEGFTSSLAADSLNSIGIEATDIDGGFAAWRAAGLPTVAGGTPPGEFVSEPR